MTELPIIVGTKFFEHDSAIFLLDPVGKEIFAISTERVTRIKHDAFTIEPILKEYTEYFAKKRQYEIYHSFAEFSQTVDYCLETRAESYFKYKLYGELRDVYKPKYIKDVKILREKYYSLGGKLKFIIDFLRKNKGKKTLALLSNVIGMTTVKNAPKNNKKYILKMMDETVRPYIDRYELGFKPHHLTHAVSAYYFSPFQPRKSLVFTIDGHGDGSFTTLWMFEKDKRTFLAGSRVHILSKGGQSIVCSIGTLYSLFTEMLGFVPNSDEGKTEALAAYGRPEENLLKELSVAFSINEEKLRWEFNPQKGAQLFDKKYLESWIKRLKKEDIAATVQHWLETQTVDYLNLVYKKYRVKQLCLAGGVAANIIMNLHIYEKTPFEELYIFPAMGDDGTACGAAVLRALELGVDVSWLKEKKMPYFGPEISKQDVEEELDKPEWAKKIRFTFIGEQWPALAAQEIAKGNIVAIVQGKMEFGPRALGNRSILADPRKKETRERINSTVKRRPYFQPFCPSALEEERERLFQKSFPHKHMATAFRLKEEFLKDLPSATHIDGTARPQFVEKTDNPDYYTLLTEFKKLTGYGIVVNTSFNLHGRTIVRTVQDAFTDFVDCNIDTLFIQGYRIERANGGLV